MFKITNSILNYHSKCGHYILGHPEQAPRHQDPPEQVPRHQLAPRHQDPPERGQRHQRSPGESQVCINITTKDQSLNKNEKITYLS